MEMVSKAIDPSHGAYRCLRVLGYSDDDIFTMKPDTRLFHDLGWYGDTAIENMTLVQIRFGVDLSEFEFDRYFPPEFEGRTKFEAFVNHLAMPLVSRLIRGRATYEPATLDMLGRSIVARRWLA